MTTPVGGYYVETLDDEQVFSVEPQMEGQPIEVLVPPGSNILEVFTTPPDTHYQIGGSNPAANPAILVWYDTEGAR